MRGSRRLLYSMLRSKPSGLKPGLNRGLAGRGAEAPLFHGGASDHRGGDSHQLQARSGRAAVATGLGKFAAHAGGFYFPDVVVRGDEMVIDSPAADRGFAELYLFELRWFELYFFNFEWLKLRAFEGLADRFFCKRVFRK